MSDPLAIFSGTRCCFVSSRPGARTTTPTPSVLNHWRLPLGRVIAGEYPGSPDITVARAKLTELHALGVTTIIDLTEPSEGLRDYGALLRTLPGGRFVHHLRCPIPDVSITDSATLHRILDHIDVALDGEGTVYVHCWGGIGRTGMVAGALLVRRGLPPSGALHVVNAVSRGTAKAQLAKHAERTSPETVEQMRVVAEWEVAEIARGETRLRVIDVNAPALPKALRPVDPREAERRDRARGCLLGGAIGDALGWPVEFMKLPEIRAKFGPAGITELVVDPRTGVAEITDDTQMTLFTAEGLIHGRRDMNERGFGRLSYQIFTSYRRWLLTQEVFAHLIPTDAHEWGRLLGASFDLDFDFSNLTPSALASLPADERDSWLVRIPSMYARRAPGTTCLSALRTHRFVQFGPSAPNTSKGCGGVMRVAPIGLMVPDMAFEFAFDLACEVAGHTHGHPTGQLSAGVFAAMVWCLNEGCTMQQAVAESAALLMTKPGRRETSAAITRAVKMARRRSLASPEEVASLGQGWIAEEALAIAVYCAMRGEIDLGFEDALRLAVNHDGDSDSTGSMTGQLLGVRLGAQALPSRWVTQIELADAITRLADEVSSYTE